MKKVDLRTFYPNLASNLKNNDPWNAKPTDVPLPLVLMMSVNGQVSGKVAHDELSSDQVEALYTTLSSTSLTCVVTGVPIVPLSGYGLNKLSPDRLHSHLEVDNPNQVLQRVSYFYNKYTTKNLRFLIYFRLKNKRTTSEMSCIESIILNSDFEYGVQVMEDFLTNETSPAFDLDPKLEKRLEELYDTQELSKRQRLSDIGKRRRTLSDIRIYSLNELKDIAKRLKGINPVLGIPLRAEDVAVDRY